MLKRLFDIISSFCGLVIIFPIILMVALFIKLTSPWPVFYRGERVGKYGKIFRMFKFRTMVVNADQIGGPSTASDDPRLTKIGLFLKKYSFKIVFVLKKLDI